MYYQEDVFFDTRSFNGGYNTSYNMGGIPQAGYTSYEPEDIDYDNEDGFDWPGMPKKLRSALRDANQTVPLIKSVSKLLGNCCRSGGKCPKCRRGALVTKYNPLAVGLSVVCFPIGVVCCCATRKHVCTNCKSKF